MSEKRLKKKRRPAPMTLEPQPGWNLGRCAKIVITTGPKMPEFWNKLVLKSKGAK